MKLKQYGSNLTVNGFVIHQLNKIAGDRNVALKTAKDTICVNQKERMFLGRLNESYYKKSNPTYGIFGGADPRFRTALENYLSSQDFLTFSIEGASLYKKTLEATIGATGGFLIFSDFINSENNNRYLLILTINNKDGYVVSEVDLTLQDIKNLDLSKVDVACMINLTRWKAIEDGSDQESKTYLSFVRGNKDVSYYFMSFVDCDNKTTNTESTKRLIKALDEYTTEKGYDRTTRIKKKNEVYEYCTDRIKQKEEIQLASISALLDPDNIDDFLHYAASEKYGVSETIKGDRTQLRRIKYIMYKDSKYTLEFDADLLGKEIIYNKQKNELTFKKLPEALISQIP